MPAAICPNCGHPIDRKMFPFCAVCRLLVIAQEELDLNPAAPLKKIYSDDDGNDDPTEQ